MRKWPITKRVERKQLRFTPLGTSSVPRYSDPERAAEYCDERVCLSVCLRDHIFGTACPIFTEFLVHVIHGSGSVFLWRRSDSLCTSGFMDDVIFAHKPRNKCKTTQAHALVLRLNQEMS